MDQVYSSRIGDSFTKWNVPRKKFSRRDRGGVGEVHHALKILAPDNKTCLKVEK